MVAVKIFAGFHQFSGPACLRDDVSLLCPAFQVAAQPEQQQAATPIQHTSHYTLAITHLLAPYLNSHPTLIQPPQSVDSRYLWSLSYSIQLIYLGLCQFLFLHLLSEDESCESWVMFISHSFNAQCSVLTVQNKIFRWKDNAHVRVLKSLRTIHLNNAS